MAKLSKINNVENRLVEKAKLRSKVKLDTILQIVQISLLLVLLYRSI
jgi:hypothetical protein